jgi:hypothetical protein
MTSTNLLGSGEVPSPRRLLAVNEHQTEDFWLRRTAKRPGGCHWVVEDGMVGKRCEISRESPVEQGPEFMIRKDPKSWRHGAVRAFIVAWKSRNWDGAKGRRKMETR